MMIALHKNARTTPAIRAEMAASSESGATLALRYGVSEGTVYKWKGRESFQDASHTPHRLQTTLTLAQEQIVVELRKMLLLPLDDLLAVTREFLCPQATRSGLDRCLRRHGVGILLLADGIGCNQGAIALSLCAGLCQIGLGLGEAGARALCRHAHTACQRRRRHAARLLERRAP